MGVLDMSVLDVLILNFEEDGTACSIGYLYSSKLQKIIVDFNISIINAVFGKNNIPNDCTQQEINLLKTKISNLSTTRQIYMLQHLLDCEYCLSYNVGDLEYEKNEKVEEIIMNSNLRIFLNGSLINKEQIPDLEKKYKIKIFFSSNDFNVKKIRKEKLIKITENANNSAPDNKRVVFQKNIMFYEKD